MRLDQFLVASRIIKRRSLAQEFCEKGRIHVNHTAAKSAKEIKAGDEIEIRRNTEDLTIRVLKLPVTKQISKTGADDLFETIRVEKLEDTI
jgi:ribosomal 50S subunit-recycling heat shock protein